MNTRSKKGNAWLDLIIAVIILFMAAMIIGFFYIARGELQPELVEMMINDTNSSDPVVQNISQLAIVDSYNNYPSLWDGAYLFLFLGLWITSLIGAFLIDSHPVFYVITIIILIPTMVMGVLLANAYHDTIISDPANAPMQTAFPMTYYIMSHLLIVILLFVGTQSIALFGKMIIR